MMRPVNTAFKLRPEAFNGVGMAATANVFLRAVVHNLMAVTQLGNVVVGGIFVRVNLRSRLDRGSNLLDGVGSPDDIHNLRLDAATPLHNADYRGLVLRTTPTLTGFLAADVGFIGLAFASELYRAIHHELANLMAHAPSGFVGDSNLPFNLLCGYAVLGIGHEHDGKEPRGQRRNGLVENCPCRWVKLIAAPRTAIGTAFVARIKTIFLATFRASPAIRPAGFKQIIQTGPVVWKLLLKIS